jgi:hypothetical protein
MEAYMNAERILSAVASITLGIRRSICTPEKNGTWLERNGMYARSEEPATSTDTNHRLGT